MTETPERQEEPKGRFKNPTAKDWLEPDPTGRMFVEINAMTGERRDFTADRWAECFLGVDLDPSVPEQVREMWSIARGVLLYGWFFYPLYAIGDRELHRVADAAVLHRYRDAGGPTQKDGKWPSLNRRLDWLLREGLIPEEVEGRWDAIREVRNEATHADYPALLMPMDAMRSLDILAKEIDALFAS